MQPRRKAFAFFVALAFSYISIIIYISKALGLPPGLWVPLALVDSINPCEITIQALVGLSVALSSSLTAGFIIAVLYAFGVITSYLSIGLGLSYILAYIPTWFAGSVAIAYGSYILLSSLLHEAEEGCPTCVEKGRSKLHFLNLGYLGGFALGVLIGFTVSPCTLGPYPIFLTLIKDFSMPNKLVALLGYNLVFGAPLFILSLLISITEVFQKTQLLILRNYRRIKTVSSILMIAVGVYILYLYLP